jgi:hypothetical protein
MDKIDAVRKSIAETSGARPHFLNDPDSDRLLAMVLALSGELATVYERLDTLERVLEDKHGLKREDLEAYQPDDGVSKDRLDWSTMLVERVLRVLKYELNALEKDKGA